MLGLGGVKTARAGGLLELGLGVTHKGFVALVWGWLARAIGAGGGFGVRRLCAFAGREKKNGLRRFFCWFDFFIVLV